MSIYIQAAPAATDFSQLKRSGFTRAIVSRVSTACLMSSLPTSRFPVLRLPTLFSPTVLRLQDIVNNSDAIILLTDMCESRFFPTVMSRALGKTLINASLGLDGWLVIRHGIYGRASDCLGWYFFSPRELHARQDRQLAVHSDPAVIGPRGVSHGSRDPGGPVPPPPD